MKFPPLHFGTVVERQKRFKLLVDFGDHLEWAYLPNPGRLRELIYPGAPVWLKPVHSVKRKLAYEAVLAMILSWSVCMPLWQTNCFWKVLTCSV